MTVDTDKLSTGWAIIEKLTLNKLFLGFIGVLMCIVLYSIWENKAHAYQALTTSTLLQAILAMIVLFTGLGAAIGAVIRYVDAQRDAVYRSLSDRIADMQATIAALQARERDCQALLLQERTERLNDRDRLEDLLRKGSDA